MRNFQVAFLLVLLTVYSIHGEEMDVPEVAVEEVESDRENRNCGKTGDDCEYRYERCCDGFRCRYTGRTARLFICL
uniref:Putative neurotoxin LTDF S-01 n=1 Tax=Dolomedes fimbriatus TaxID=1432569 RepID=A0A0K1D8G8_9ARAC|nr:putative neurotoxin LTDF S-01 [Dolomedes fimbriatus]